MPLEQLQVSLTSNPFPEQQHRNLPRLQELPVKSRVCRAQGLCPPPNLCQGPWAALPSSREEWGALLPAHGGWTSCSDCARQHKFPQTEAADRELETP